MKLLIASVDGWFAGGGGHEPPENRENIKSNNTAAHVGPPRDLSALGLAASQNTAGVARRFAPRDVSCATWTKHSTNTAAPV